MSGEIEIVKDIAKANLAAMYEDAAQPAVRVVGKTLAQCTALFATPVGRVAEIFERNIHLYLDKLEGLDESQIVAPSTRVLVPILEKLRYTDDAIVADYYAQILATASNKESAESVSIAFIEILNRLTPDELKLLEYINSPVNSLMLVNDEGVSYSLDLGGSLPVINVHTKRNTGGYFVSIKNLSYATNKIELNSINNYNLYIDNMIALGLMIRPYGTTTNDKNVYKFIKELKAQEIDEVKSSLDSEHSIEFAEARIEVTDLGRQLIKVGSKR